MSGSKFTNTTQVIREPLETLTKKVAQPILEEAGRELEGFFGVRHNLKGINQEIAAEELRRAREEIELKNLGEKDDQNSDQKVQELQGRISVIKEQYHQQKVNSQKQEGEFREEYFELSEEIAQLAKTTGVETKVHLQSNSKKVGILDIKLLRWIIRFLKIKAEESKSAQELISQRSNAKRTTGMLAWVSGKQMKVHEQGTLHLQG